MWRQRLEDYQATSNARLQAATRGAQQKSQIREDIANQRATQQEAVAQSEITGEQGKSVQQIADDIGIPGVAKTTELLGKGLTSLGKRIGGRITTQEMLGLPKVPTLLQKSAPEAQVRDLTEGTTTYKAPVQEFDNPAFEPSQLDKDPLEVGEAGLKDLFGETDKAPTTLTQRTEDVGEGLSVTVSYHPETNEPIEVFVTSRGKASDNPMRDALYNLGVKASKMMQGE